MNYRLILLSLAIFSIIFGFIHSDIVFSDEVTVEATVDRTQVELGSFLQLTVKINGVSSIEPIELPEMSGLQARYLGPATSISFVNGQYAKSISFMYNIYPLEEGQFEMPAIDILHEGRSIKTQPIKIKVDDVASISEHNNVYSEQSAALKDKIFIIMDISKDEVYLHEMISLNIKLFVNGLSVKEIQYPEFDHVGFSVDEYQEPKRYNQIVGGLRYEVVEFKTFIYPTRVGALTIGPAKQLCSIIFRNSSGRSSSFRGFESVFDDDFFDGFFNTYDVRPITLTSADLKINVLPLPENNKPENFSGAVGSFNLEVTVQPREIKVGDPITVRLAVSGDGNLKAVKMPSFKELGDDQGLFKFYDPEISEDSGVKIYEQVVIPTRENIKELPSISFSYFDVDNRKYETITEGPFPLDITKLEDDEAFKVIGYTPDTDSKKEKSPEKLGSDISFIKSMPGRLKPIGRYFYNSLLFYILIALVLVAWVVAFLVMRFTHRIKTDTKFARRLLAPRQAKKGLALAKKCIKNSDQKQFYDVLFKTLQEYLMNKFHLPVGSVNLITIEKIMKANQNKTKQTIMGYIKAVFKECEMVRYASANLDKEKMKVNYKRTEEIIDFFERSW